MAITFNRPCPPDGRLPALISEAHRLEPFAPPFRFTSFFSPEDTLLCALASEAAVGRFRERSRARDGCRLLELTTGSGLVGLHLLRHFPSASLLGVDVDTDSPAVAGMNAQALGLAARARFHQLDLWDAGMPELMADAAPHVLVCNPPYIPEPSDGSLPVEAGAGRDGAAHIRRVIDLSCAAHVPFLALSWCSLSDPVGIVKYAERGGYCLTELFVVAIAEGEYSGRVHPYLRSLPTAFMAEDADTTAAVASDGSARFAYLLMAGAFTGQEHHGGATPDEGSRAVGRLVRGFAEHGLAALMECDTAPPTICWILDRWDEIALRVLLHGHR